MPLPDCRLYYYNQEIIHDPPLYQDYYLIDDGKKIKNFNPSILWNKEHVPRSREKGIDLMVRSVIEKYNISDEFILHIRIADDPWGGLVRGPLGWIDPDISVTNNIPQTAFGFSVYNKRYDLAFPDYMYVGQPESGLINYTETIKNFVDTTPINNKVGWVGSLQCEGFPRKKFLEMSLNNTEILECKLVAINTFYMDGYKDNPDKMSYQEQINQWKYLIDMEGCGWSGRFKVLMSSPRIVFFVDRPYHEWYFGEMIPWKHYVPVKRDLSDLIDNYNRIEGDTDLQNYIKTNQKIFAQKYLTRDAAEKRIHEIILKMIDYLKENPAEINFYRGKHREISEWIYNQNPNDFPI